MQVLHRHGTERTTNPSGGILMKYKVIYIVLYEDGSYITDNAFKDLEFEEATNLADAMNKHLWKFHQDNRPSVYTVREMK